MSQILNKIGSAGTIKVRAQDLYQTSKVFIIVCFSLL